MIECGDSCHTASVVAAPHCLHSRPPETDREVSRKLTVIDLSSWCKVLSIMAVFVAEQQRPEPLPQVRFQVIRPPARTLDAFQWKIGRTCSPLVFSERKARSTRARLLEARTAPASSRCRSLKLVGTT